MSRARFRGMAIAGLLLGGCLLLGNELLARLGASTVPPALPTSSGEARPLPRLEPTTFTPPTLEALTDLRERPLFSPTRRPPEPAVERKPPLATIDEPPAPTIDFTVQGVILLPERKAALLALDGEERRLWVQEGEEIQGWQIDEISAAGIRVSQGLQHHTLPLGPDKAGNGVGHTPSFTTTPGSRPPIKKQSRH